MVTESYSPKDFKMQTEGIRANNNFFKMQTEGIRVNNKFFKSEMT